DLLGHYPRLKSALVAVKQSGPLMEWSGRAPAHRDPRWRPDRGRGDGLQRATNGPEAVSAAALLRCPDLARHPVSRCLRRRAPSLSTPPLRCLLGGPRGGARGTLQRVTT